MTRAIAAVAFSLTMHGMVLITVPPSTRWRKEPGAAAVACTFSLTAEQGSVAAPSPSRGLAAARTVDAQTAAPVRSRRRYRRRWRRVPDEGRASARAIEPMTQTEAAAVVQPTPAAPGALLAAVATGRSETSQPSAQGQGVPTSSRGAAGRDHGPRGRSARSAGAAREREANMLRRYLSAVQRAIRSEAQRVLGRAEPTRSPEPLRLVLLLDAQGHVTHAHVDSTSGSRRLDRLVAAAARRMHLPARPPQLHQRTIRLSMPLRLAPRR